MSDIEKKDNNLIDFIGEKILYDLEKKIKSINKNSESLEVVKIAKAIFRGKIDVPIKAQISESSSK